MDSQDLIELSSGVVIGMVLGSVLGIVAALLVWSPNSDTSGTDQARLSGVQSPRLHARSLARESDQMQRCVEAALEVKPALRRATSSVDQWEVHVGAMNKLVLGAITLQQATAFWNQTRVGARQRITAFDRAWRRVKRHGLDCPPSSLLATQAPPQLHSCAREVADDLRALHTARSAINTWRRHVHAMDMLRMGKMSPATATQMWLGMWQRGRQEIVSYRAAAHAAHRESGCVNVPPTSSTTSP